MVNICMRLFILNPLLDQGDESNKTGYTGSYDTNLTQ